MFYRKKFGGRGYPPHLLSVIASNLPLRCIAPPPIFTLVYDNVLDLYGGDSGCYMTSND